MAATKILNARDFAKNEIQNAVIQVLAAAPGTPVEGQFYYNSTSKRVEWHSGADWIDPTARANHSGTQSWGTILGTPTSLAGYGITDAAPSSHVGAGGAAHANVVAAGAAGFMTGADKTKLDGVAAGATANSSDVVLLARANHTGTQAAATISDLGAVVQAYRLDQFAVPTADISLNSHKLTNVTDPVGAQDAATKKYVDDARAGIMGVKDPVRIVAQANVALSAPGATIDGVALSVGDRFLAPIQSTTAQCGLYVFNGAAVAATRAPDGDAEGDVVDGTVVAVAEGTDAGKQYIQRATSTGAPGTWSQDWAVFSTGGTTYSAGPGMTLASTTFAVGAGAGIVVNADDVAVDTSVVVRKYAADVGDGASTSLTVTHNLGTKDVTVGVRDAASDAFVECDIVAATINTVTLGFTVAPTAAQYRAVVHG